AERALSRALVGQITWIHLQFCAFAGAARRRGRAMRRPLMLVSYRWLRELLPDSDLEPSQFEDALSAVGLAVDGVHNYAEALREVLLVEVLKVEPHPSRDGLRLVTIRTRGSETVPTLGSIPPRVHES